MRNNNCKKPNTQFPSTQGRAADQVKTMLTNFFEASSFDDTELLLSDLLQAYISPDPNCVHSNNQIANTVFAVREITNLLRKLESLANQQEGVTVCV